MPQTIAPGVEPIQFITLFFVMMSTILLAWVLACLKHYWTWILPGFFWLIHALIFYIVLMLERAGGVAFDVSYTTWSAILRLHGAITLFCYIVVLLYIIRQRGCINIWKWISLQRGK